MQIVVGHSSEHDRFLIVTEKSLSEFAASLSLLHVCYGDRNFSHTNHSRTKTSRTLMVESRCVGDMKYCVLHLSQGLTCLSEKSPLYSPCTRTNPKKLIIHVPTKIIYTWFVGNFRLLILIQSKPTCSMDTRDHAKRLSR